MPIYSTYVTNVPDGTTIKIVSGKLAANIDDSSIKYGSYGAATDKVYSPVVPIGCLIWAAANITGFPAMPANFQICDGAAINDAASPMNGQNTPDYITNNSFVRSNSTAGGTGGAATHTHTGGDHNHTNTFSNGSGATKTEGYGGGSHTHTATNHEPPYVDAVPYIRIK